MKKFLLYVVLIMVSLFGTDLTDFTLGIWVLDKFGESTSSYTGIWFFEAAPGVFLAPFIGGLIDRWDKKKIIIYGQLVAGLGSLSLLYLYSVGKLLPWHIMLVAGIGSIASIFVFRAFYVATVSLVSKDKLVKAQGISTSIFASIGIIAPIIAPYLYKLLGLDTIFLIDVVTFTVSIIAFLVVSFAVTEKSDERFNIRSDWKVVKGLLKEKKGLVNLFFLFFLVSFSMGLVMVAFAPLVLDFSTEYMLGNLLSVIAVGGLVAGIIMGSIKKINKPIRTILFINIIVGFILASIWLNFNLYTLGIAGFLVILFFTISESCNDVFYQVVIPSKMLGRLSGFEMLFVGAAEPLAFLLAGAFIDYFENALKGVSSDILGSFPGTIRTPAILILFLISGTILIIVSIIHLRNKKIKQLDVIYNEEIKEYKESVTE